MEEEKREEEQREEEQKEVVLKDRKKATWTYNQSYKSMKVVFPSGLKGVFDLSAIMTGITTSQACAIYYGVKQWMASNSAAEKTEATKLASFQTDYKDFIEHGLVFSGEGQITIGGGVRRSVRGVKTQDALVLPMMSTYTDEQIISLMTTVEMGLVILSDEVKKVVEERFQAIEVPEPRQKGKKQH